VADVIQPASACVLAAADDSRCILTTERNLELRFFGGYFAFPGGKLDASDGEVAVRTPSGPMADPHRAAVVRELFEETGILLARRADGSFPTDSHTWRDERRALLKGELAFPQFLARKGLHLQAGDLVAAGHLVTPAFSPVRFDTAFFVAQAPSGQQVEIWPGELVGHRWDHADALLARWSRGEILLSPPTVTLLEAIAGRSVFDLPARLRLILERLDRGSIPPIFFAPGVQMIPLRTVALPPTEFTNAFLVGTSRKYLIDPGAHEEAELARLFEVVDQVDRLDAIVLTHHHPDHVNGVNACRQRYGLPVWAHPLTEQALEGTITVERHLVEGERLPLGASPDGAGEWFLETLHTPGHAAGHLAFFEPRYRLLFAGDLVSMLSSVVIAPPDGDLTAYLASLERVGKLEARLLLPSHGPPTNKPARVLADAVAHRRKREEELLRALAGPGPHTPDSLTAQLYVGLPEQLRFLARWQLLAGLEKLLRDGRVVRCEGEESIYALA